MVWTIGLCFLKLRERETLKRKKRASRVQVQKWRGRKFNHAPRAGKELTAGGSRTQTSIADATGNVPSAISRVGSRAVAIELCRATERRLHHRRWNASCIDRRSTAGSDAARWRARAVTKWMQSSCQRPPVPAARTRNTHRSLSTRSL